MSFHIQDIHRNDLNTEDTQKQQQKKHLIHYLQYK